MLSKGWAKYKPQTGFGPPRDFVRPEVGPLASPSPDTGSTLECGVYGQSSHAPGAQWGWDGTVVRLHFLTTPAVALFSCRCQIQPCCLGTLAHLSRTQRQNWCRLVEGMGLHLGRELCLRAGWVWGPRIRITALSPPQDPNLSPGLPTCPASRCCSLPTCSPIPAAQPFMGPI